MKPYKDLTRQGRLRRLRRLAGAALSAFGMENAAIEFIRDAGNTTYRISSESISNTNRQEDNRFSLNQYVLRMHEPGYQTDAAILSELEWLAALGRDTDLAVPAPVRAPDGRLLVEVSIPDVPQPRRVSLLRWVKGSLLKKGIRPAHFKSAGRLMAGLHNHSSQWTFPQGFSRPHYDWNGLYGDNDFINVLAPKVRAQIPDEFQRPYEQVTGRLREVMDSFGQGADAFGLIHADISLGHNILFKDGQARVIDFDDCAFGYWMFDIGVNLCEIRKETTFEVHRDALREGYEQLRLLPPVQWEHVDLFIAAWHAFEMFWAASGIVKFGDSRGSLRKWVERAARDILFIFGEKSG
jgi:Ser/Thr protein kinase RdoA (MazF antagonist)